MKASHKIWIAVDNYFIKIYKMILLNIAFEVKLKEGNSIPFLFNDYKKARRIFALEFLQKCVLVKGLVQDLLHRDLKVMKNNRNTLLELTFLCNSISFKVTLSQQKLLF